MTLFFFSLVVQATRWLKSKKNSAKEKLPVPNIYKYKLIHHKPQTGKKSRMVKAKHASND